MILGIDVSSVQGTIDHQRIAKQGIEFAVCKATSGIGHDLDPFFARNMASFRQAGIKRSLYHWWVWSRDPVAQAEQIEWAVGLANGVDFPIAIDFESPAPETWAAKGCNPIHMIENVLGCSDDVARRTGRKPLLYTYPWFISSLLAPRNKVPDELVVRLADQELWIASGQNYGKRWTPTQSDTPPIPKPWASWRMWQYSGNGGQQLAGIIGDVDRNEFNGDKAAWDEWCAGAPLKTLPDMTKGDAAMDTVPRATR